MWILFSKNISKTPDSVVLSFEQRRILVYAGYCLSLFDTKKVEDAFKEINEKFPKDATKRYAWLLQIFTSYNNDVLCDRNYFKVGKKRIIEQIIKNFGFYNKIKLEVEVRISKIANKKNVINNCLSFDYDGNVFTSPSFHYAWALDHWTERSIVGAAMMKNQKSYEKYFRLQAFKNIDGLLENIMGSILMLLIPLLLGFIVFSSINIGIFYLRVIIGVFFAIIVFLVMEYLSIRKNKVMEKVLDFIAILSPMLVLFVKYTTIPVVCSMAFLQWGCLFIQSNLLCLLIGIVCGTIFTYILRKSYCSFLVRKEFKIIKDFIASEYERFRVERYMAMIIWKDNLGCIYSKVTSVTRRDIE